MILRIYAFPILIIIWFAGIPCQVFSQSKHTVFLIGDAGKDPKPGPVLRMLQNQIEQDSNSTVVFLGDNCYPQGVNVKDLEYVDYPYAHPAAANLVSQLTILKKFFGTVFFVPGNHDWKAQKTRNAILSIKNEEMIISSYIRDSTRIKNIRDHRSVFIWGGEGNAQKYSEYDLTDSLTLIMFDSQFYFQKIKGISRKEKLKMLDEMMVELENSLSKKEKEGKQIIIASHHPLFTNGYHSKFRQPLRFLFNWTPLYLLGKLGVNRWLSQDIDQPFYEKYRKAFLALLEKHKGIYFVAGHDHNLQYITETDDFHIVSGAGSKIRKLRKKNRFESAYGNANSMGFVRLEFENGHTKMIVTTQNEVELKLILR